jgi:hypothetical protein
MSLSVQNKRIPAMNSPLNPLNYKELSPEFRAGIAFEAHTLEDIETVQLIEASFKCQSTAWCLYADRLTNLNLLILSLTGIYWKLAATHDFRSAWATQEVIKAVCEQAEINTTLIFECNDIEQLPAPVQYDADWLQELKQSFIAKL